MVKVNIFCEIHPVVTNQSIQSIGQGQYIFGKLIINNECYVTVDHSSTSTIITSRILRNVVGSYGTTKSIH